MLQKKICLLGAFSVGKTSLIQRYVSSLFDDKYLTTVGVKIDKKIVELPDQKMMLMIWDLAGEDDYNSLKLSHLRGASGYILVVDGTRPKSLEVAIEIQKLAQGALGDVPFIIATNKADLQEQWMLSDEDINSLKALSTVVSTSAKNGDNVEALFTQLALGLS
jgi:small GTP-binding protein